MNPHVYCITNKINGKKYIGKHNGNNPQYFGSGTNLKLAVKKYGKNNFIKHILWEGPIEYLNEIEEYWLDYFDCVNNSQFYNLTNKTSGTQSGKKIGPQSEEHKNKRIKSITGIKRTEDQKKNVSNGRKGVKNANHKQINQYDLKGNFIKEWSNITELKKTYKSAINGLYTGKPANGFLWKFK